MHLPGPFHRDATEYHRDTQSNKPRDNECSKNVCSNLDALNKKERAVEVEDGEVYAYHGYAIETFDNNKVLS